MIPKGTLVLIKTNNGGEMVARLIANYRRTYDAVAAVGAGYAFIPASHIVSVEALAKRP